MFFVCYSSCMLLYKTRKSSASRKYSQFYNHVKLQFVSGVDTTYYAVYDVEIDYLSSTCLLSHCVCDLCRNFQQLA